MAKRSEDLSRDAAARLTAQYRRALREYVAGGSEAALTQAYELGRAAASCGLGVLDLALLHHEALSELTAGEAGGRIAAAAQFAAESLSPFEMTLRSYRANARLLGLTEVLAEQNAEIDRAREQLRTILDATSAVIYLKDAAGRYLFVNRGFAELFGVSREAVLGKLDAEVLPPEAASTLHRDDADVLRARAPHELEEVVPSPRGPHTFLSLKFPLLDANGAPYAICCVATDITERKRAEAAIQEARAARERQEALEREVAARDQFMSIAAHELRTPLTSLKLQVETFRRASRDATASPGYVQAVRSKIETFARHVDRLAGLMNTLLAVSTITSGPMHLSNERLELVDVVRAVVARMATEIRASGSELSVQAADPAVGEWDRQSLEVVVGHLLSNALKFGNGKPIEIAVATRSDRASVTVRDQGLGIAPEDVRRIFERFERAVPVAHFGGFGIGLWVARQTIEAMGGTITVASEPGRGSAFTVELPLRRG